MRTQRIRSMGSRHNFRSRYVFYHQELGTAGRRMARKDVLDDSIWSLLPEDLIHIVLAHLPVPDLLRFRVVCKKWNTLIPSALFRDVCAGIPCRNPMVVVCGMPRQAKADDTVVSTTSLRKLPIAKEVTDHRWLDLKVVAGGLLCYAAQHSWDKSGPGSTKTFFVSNPCTREKLQLPLLLERDAWTLDHVSMASCSQQDAYKVFVTGRDAQDTSPLYALDGQTYNCRTNYIAAVYDSSAREWDVARTLFPGPKLERHTSAFVQGCFYGFARVSQCGEALLAALVSYDVQEKHWTKVPIWRTPTSISMRNAHLVECRENLYAVEFLWPVSEKESGGVAIWRFHQENVPTSSAANEACVTVDPKCMWSLVTTMPGELFKLSQQVDGCFAHGDEIFLVTDNPTPHLAAYNLLYRSWHWPSSFGINGFEELGFQRSARIACFYPRWHSRF